MEEQHDAGASGGLSLADLEVVDAHIHLSKHYSGGLPNAWQPTQGESFHRDFTEDDFRSAAASAGVKVKAAVFVECFNEPAFEEAKWVLGMVDDPNSIVAGVTAHIEAQRGARAVEDFLQQLRLPDGSLPRGLKGARFVFPAWERNSPTACLDPEFLEGLGALEKAGLVWEFCCFPSMAPHLHACCSKFPKLTIVVDHLAHNTNDGGEMEAWGPAIDALGKLPNVYAKMGAVEEWDVPNPEDYLDRAIKAFGFDRVMYESNWFVSEAMGFDYARTPSLLLAACKRAGAGPEELQAVFAGNACRAYGLEL